MNKLVDLVKGAGCLRLPSTSQLLGFLAPAPVARAALPTLSKKRGFIQATVGNLSVSLESLDLYMTTAASQNAKQADPLRVKERLLSWTVT